MRTRETIKKIEFLTNQFKKKRLGNETYIKLMYEELFILSENKTKSEYLKNLDQN